jgi:hypothetical protein
MQRNPTLLHCTGRLDKPSLMCCALQGPKILIFKHFLFSLQCNLRNMFNFCVKFCSIQLAFCQSCYYVFGLALGTGGKQRWIGPMFKGKWRLNELPQKQLLICPGHWPRGTLQLSASSANLGSKEGVLVPWIGGEPPQVCSWEKVTWRKEEKQSSAVSFAPLLPTFYKTGIFFKQNKQNKTNRTMY